jgi:hypothetical protein
MIISYDLDGRHSIGDERETIDAATANASARLVGANPTGATKSSGRAGIASPVLLCLIKKT